MIDNDTFVKYVSNLHAEKHAVYGDSWKRRGEAVAILANIARKVDRLGVAGAGDTSADTAVDLLVYLLKYRCWLYDNLQELAPNGILYYTGQPIGDGPAQVDILLKNLPPMREDAEKLAPTLIEDTQQMFERLLAAQAAGAHRYLIVDHMTKVVNQLARYLWSLEQLGPMA